jgi:hypothetical protein
MQVRVSCESRDHAKLKCYPGRGVTSRKFRMFRQMTRVYPHELTFEKRVLEMKYNNQCSRTVQPHPRWYN